MTHFNLKHYTYYDDIFDISLTVRLPFIDVLCNRLVQPTTPITENCVLFSPSLVHVKRECHSTAPYLNVKRIQLADVSREANVILLYLTLNRAHPYVILYNQVQDYYIENCYLKLNNYVFSH